MKKYTFNIINILFILALNLYGQTYDLKFNSINSDQSNYDVQVQIKASSEFKLAASNITFNYNTSAISSPTLLSAQNFSGVGGSPLHIYSDMTVTQPNDGIASVNITYTQTNDTFASEVLTDWTNVGLVRFSIIDINSTPDLNFRTSGMSPTIIYKIDGNNLTLINPGALQHFNEPLPVELTNFSVKLVDKELELSWNTSNEINNYGFEIEKSQKSNLLADQGDIKDELEWLIIGFIQGSGNSNSTKNYTFKDKTANGIYYYRLKQIDTDGKYNYSEPISIEVNLKPENYSLMNYPNPFNPLTTIRFEIPQISHVNLVVYNIVGEKVITLVDEVMNAGEYKKTFSSDSYYGQLASGIYFYRLTTDNGVNITRKMLLLK